MLKKKVNEEIKWLLQPTKRKELSWFYQMVFARCSPLNTFWSSENKSWYSPVLGRVRLYFVVFLKLQRRHMGCVGSGSVSPSLAPECCSFRMNDQQSTLPISNSYSVRFRLGIMIWHWYKWNKCVKKYIDTCHMCSTVHKEHKMRVQHIERKGTNFPQFAFCLF